MQQNIDEIRLNFNDDNLLLLNFLLAFLMFGIALNLKVEDFKMLLKYPRKTIAGILSQWVVLPLLSFLLVVLVKPAPSVALGIILLGCCPGGNMSNYLSNLSKANVALSVTLTACSTVLCIILTPLNFAFYGNMYPPTKALLEKIEINPWEMFITVFIILTIPLIFGMFISNTFPNLTKKILKPVQVISLLIFIAFIVFALLANFNIFMQVIGGIFLLVLVHNAICMFAGYSIATLFRMDFKDKKCLAIETGIHNAALGLILIFTFFEGLGGMAIVAGWWGIWDLIAGGLIASYWSRRG
jgi:BASS family bile acid:Na+ symporter